MTTPARTTPSPTRLSLVVILMMAAPLVLGCPDKSTDPDYVPPESVSRTECPAGQHAVEGVCVANGRD